VNEWIGIARIKDGQVRGTEAILTPGSLSSGTSIEIAVLQRLVGSKVPVEIARVLAKELASAWNGWAAGFTLHRSLPNRSGTRLRLSADFRYGFWNERATVDWRRQAIDGGQS